MIRYILAYIRSFFHRRKCCWVCNKNAKKNIKQTGSFFRPFHTLQYAIDSCGTNTTLYLKRNHKEKSFKSIMLSNKIDVHIIGTFCRYPLYISHAFSPFFIIDHRSKGCVLHDLSLDALKPIVEICLLFIYYLSIKRQELRTIPIFLSVPISELESEKVFALFPPEDKNTPIYSWNM